AHKLRNRTVQDKGIEEIDVVRDEKTGLVRIEAGFKNRADSGPGKEHDAAAERTLQPVMLLWVEDDGQRDQTRNRDGKVQKAYRPEQGAADHIPDARHM